MSALLLDYLPLVIFVAVSLVIDTIALGALIVGAPAG